MVILGGGAVPYERDTPVNTPVTTEVRDQSALLAQGVSQVDRMLARVERV